MDDVITRATNVQEMSTVTTDVVVNNSISGTDFLIVVYALVVLLLVVRFINHLFQIYKTIKANTILDLGNHSIVTIKEGSEATPYPLESMFL